MKDGRPETIRINNGNDSPQGKPSRYFQFNFKTFWNEEWKEIGLKAGKSTRQYLISSYGRLAVAKPAEGMIPQRGSLPSDLDEMKDTLENLPSTPNEKGNDSPEGKPSLILFKPVIVNKYPALNIRIDKFGTQLYYIHKLVAELFLPPPSENQKFVIHKDYNPNNNYVENLAWASAKERGSHQKHNPLFVKVKSKPKYKKLGEGRKTPAHPKNE